MIVLSLLKYSAIKCNNITEMVSNITICGHTSFFNTIDSLDKNAGILYKITLYYLIFMLFCPPSEADDVNDHTY